MEQFKDIANRIQPSNGSASLVTQSGKQPNAAMGLDLLTLMAQAQAYKPNQTLPDGTPDVYLVAWEEIAEKYGMKMFQSGLWKALRKSQFFPDPLDIEEECRVIRSADYDGKALDAIKAREKVFRDSGEKVTNFADLIREASVNVGRPIEQPKVMDTSPILLCCPQCSFVMPVPHNMRPWTGEETVAYGKVLLELEEIAAAKRAASLAAQAIPLSEVTA